MPEWLGTAIIVAVLVVVCVFAVLSYRRKLSKGCCGTTGSEEKRLAEKQGDFSHTVQVTVGEMTCEKCAIRIENGFNRLDGVKASVDHRSGIAVVCSEQPLSPLMIRKTVVELGYTVINIEDKQ